MFFTGILRHIAGLFLSHLAFFIGSNCTNAFLYSFFASFYIMLRTVLLLHILNKYIKCFFVHISRNFSDFILQNVKLLLIES